MLRKFFLAQALVAMALGAHLYAGEVSIARKGQAQVPIVVRGDSGEELLKLANELKGYLDRITGADFEVTPMQEPRGIILGTREQFPDILSEPVKGEAPSWMERYRIVSKDGSLYLVGETVLAVQNAMFDLLESLGYRQFFPHPAWEIVPQSPDIAIAVDRTEEPGYATRYMFYGGVTDKEIIRTFGVNKIEGRLNKWKRKNRARSATMVQSAHNWHRIAGRHAEEFAAHPEWISGVQENDWKTPDNTGWKWRVENEDLRRVLRKDILDYFTEKPDAATYSIDPTDGYGWPENSPIGTPSDQMVYLANDLIASLKEKFPGKKVAFYAYNMHSPPPSLKLDGKAIVNVATDFIRGGYTVEQLMREWKAKGAELGIRDYNNVFFGSWDLPGNNTYVAFSPDKSRDTIRKYYKDGARYWISELDDAWGAIGLGTYISARTQWDPVNGPTTEEFKNDFLEKSFGPVAETVRQYFDVVDPKNKPLLSPDMFGRMYDPLLAALKENKDPAVKERLLQLLVYTHFSELMHQFRNASGQERVDAYRQLAEWSLRYREAQMFSARHVFQRIGLQEQKKKWQEQEKNELIPVARDLMARQKSFQPLPEDDLIKLATTRAQNAQRMSFKPVVFPSSLVRGDFPAQPAQETYQLSGLQRLLWLGTEPGSELEVSVRALGGRPSDPPPISISVTHVDDVLDAPADTKEIAADGEWHTVKLRAGLAGLHRVAILDPSNHLEIKWPQGTPIVFPMGQMLHGMPRVKDLPFSGWIYVPAGADRIAGYSENTEGRILDPDGKVILDFAKTKVGSYFDAEIAPSGQPRVFKLEGIKGKIMFMTTPPYVARSPDELLVPGESHKLEKATPNETPTP